MQVACFCCQQNDHWTYVFSSTIEMIGWHIMQLADVCMQLLYKFLRLMQCTTQRLTSKHSKYLAVVPYIQNNFYLGRKNHNFLATIDMGWKLGGCAPFWGELGSHLTQCCLGQGQPPYQVVSWSIKLFGHNRHGPKIGRAVPLLGRGAESPSNTMWPGMKAARTPSFILIRPTVWPQYTNVTHRQTDNGPIG